MADWDDLILILKLVYALSNTENSNHSKSFRTRSN